MNASIEPGPVMLDIDGLEMSAEDAEIIAHPLVGGLILFSRNYESPEQVTRLCQQLRALKPGPLLIAVDQEGGRVQRFKDGLTRLPPMNRLGVWYAHDEAKALAAARETGWLMASELRPLGVDFSFAPVLDLDWGCSGVIGDRAFSSRVDSVGALSAAFQAGVHAAGMATVGKHFPGHGAVAADSHTDIPVDERSLSDIRENDLLPFIELIAAGMDAVMPAHVIYPNVDSLPAGFSATWLQTILRRELGFDGVIFSDDLSMAGARVAGDHRTSAMAALEAGCDMVLVCNDRSAAEQVVDGLSGYQVDRRSRRRLMAMQGRPAAVPELADLPRLPQWQHARNIIQQLQEMA